MSFDLEKAKPLTDSLAIDVWLSLKRSPHTKRAYRKDIGEYLQVIGHSLRDSDLNDAVGYQAWLEERHFGRATRSRKIGAVKSLFKFLAHPSIRYLPWNPWELVKVEAYTSRLEHRILSEVEVTRMMMAARRPQEALVMLLLYYGGMRCAEVHTATWGDLVERPEVESGQITIHGKGDKDRVMLLPPPVWSQLWALRGEGPIVVSQKGNAMSTSAIGHMVRALARRGGVAKAVSPHWLRHAHITHALARGCRPEQVMLSVGHGSFQTTMRYVHSMPQSSSAMFLMV